MRELRLIAVVLVAFVVLIASAPPATAQTNNVVYACVHQASLQVRIVGSPGQCRATETPVSWNVAGLQGPKGDPGETVVGPVGPKGDKGDEGPVGPAGGLQGMSEFAVAGEAQSFTVPEGVTRLAVEMWGASGGGGCEYAGGGGSGAYVRAILAVTPGATYPVEVGAGGGPNPSSRYRRGDDGGTTSFSGLQAGGGSGGEDGESGGGLGGQVRQVPGDAQVVSLVVRRGNKGADNPWGADGQRAGGSQRLGSIEPPGGYRGGGIGSFSCEWGAWGGAKGDPGFVLVSW